MTFAYSLESHLQLRVAIEVLNPVGKFIVLRLALVLTAQARDKRMSGAS